MAFSKNWYKEEDIAILMKDGCTRKEAEKHLNSGTTVFDSEDFEKHFNNYMEDWQSDKETIETYKKMINNKIPVIDWSIVEDNGNTYYIMYAY